MIALTLSHRVLLDHGGVFSRLTVLCSGAIIEDIDLYGRLHEQFHMMKPSEERMNDGIAGFGTDTAANKLAAGKERVVSFTPFRRLLANTDK